MGQSYLRRVLRRNGKHLFFSSPFSPFGRELGPAPAVAGRAGVAADMLADVVLSRREMEWRLCMVQRV